MKILGIIPARGGSKGIPGKNTKLLNGKPLIAYTIEVALKSKILNHLIVSSDDDEIITVTRKFGADVPFIRPAELAQDNSSSIDLVIHALEFYQEREEYFDAICLLQPTNPFRSLNFLENSLDKFLKKDCDTLLSVLEVPHQFNPHWTFKKNSSGSLELSTGESEIIPRRQDLPKAYYRDGSIYIVKSSIILGKKSFYGDSIEFIDASNEKNVNIDTMEDWILAEKLSKEIDL